METSFPEPIEKIDELLKIHYFSFFFLKNIIAEKKYNRTRFTLSCDYSLIFSPFVFKKNHKQTFP